ncbi:hypothetical protein [Brevibacillus sp. AY1]|uniref:hypothetical protein n=1 Tax=Brevibacillus sp. AY1 TaxID=2807621 RepID=UPI002456CB19|nr:hypothetical protein [Brevibacillus sp. AY1]MDH4617376.1 hypothetical protein [Brevibacillus sp. AY1]
MVTASQLQKRTIDNLMKFRTGNQQVACLFNNLSEYGDLILVGGAIRDYAHKTLPRDIDIIVDSKISNFDEVLDSYCYRRNRFGGYKVFLENIELDIWGISNNWAFRENILDAKFENISKGSFYNFDSLALNLKTSYLDADIFIQAIREKLLDIIIEDKYINLNPTPEVNIVRAFIIRKYWELDFSNRVVDYITKWFSQYNNPIDILIEAEIKHYGKARLTSEDYHLQLFADL